MVNGLIHPIVKVTSSAVVSVLNGVNKNVKCAILVLTQISAIDPKSILLSFQVPISIQMRKLANGWEWIRLVDIPSSPRFYMILFISLTVKNLSKVTRIPLLVLHDRQIKQTMMTMMMQMMMIFLPMRGTSSKTKKSKTSSSSKSISILTRTTSEFDTCTQEKSVEFDPVQGKK